MNKDLPYYDKDEKIQYSDEYTKFLLDLLKKFAITAKDKKYLVGGGLAIDLTYGEIRRPHEDLDIYPDENDLNFWQEWFLTQGLQVVKTPDTKNYPHAFIVLDNDYTYVADIYCVRFTENGNLELLWQEGNIKKYSKWDNKNINKSRITTFQGVPIRIEDYKEVINQKLGHTKRTGEQLSEKHLFDLQTAKLIDQQKTRD